MNALTCKCSAKWGEHAPLIMRIIIGLVFLLHGWQKINEMGLANVSAFFGSLGIPAATFFAFLVMWIEFLGGIALILGLWTHLVSKLLAIIMLVATLLTISKGVLAAELPLVLLVSLISLMTTGPGKHSLGKK